MWYYSDDGENYNVYNGSCTHLACTFGRDNDGSVFLCPCHRGVYEIASGAVIERPPPRPVDTMETRVEDGILFAKLESFRPGIPDKVAVRMAALQRCGTVPLGPTRDNVEEIRPLCPLSTSQHDETRAVMLSYYARVLVQRSKEPS